MWELAEALLPESDVEAYTQGLMDLGATLCGRNRPACSQCPFAKRCVAFNTGRTQDLPVRKPKKAIPEKQTVMLVMVEGNHILLEQRPDSGIWGGLLSLPEMDMAVVQTQNRFEAALKHYIEPFGSMGSYSILPSFSHGFTHYRLLAYPFMVNLTHRLQWRGQKQFVWYAINKVVDAPLPAPIKKLLISLSGSLKGQ
jgi:A/G-specific adenine glycosylase